MNFLLIQLSIIIQINEEKNVKKGRKKKNRNKGHREASHQLLTHIYKGQCAFVGLLLDLDYCVLVELFIDVLILCALSDCLFGDVVDEYIVGLVTFIVFYFQLLYFSLLSRFCSWFLAIFSDDELSELSSRQKGISKDQN